MKLLFLLSAFPFLYSFSFTPMSQSIELSDKQKSAQFQIANEGTEKVAIELTVKERVMDVNGKETLPDTSEIKVFPPQMIIPPKEKRTIRVNWSGPSEIKTEKAFRVIAEQLPLKVDEKTKKQSGIQMLMRYMAALYVAPDGAGPKVAVVSHTSKNGNLELTIENSGNRHQVLLDPVLSIEGGKKRVLKARELEGLTGENVLAQSKRIFILKGHGDVPPQSTMTLKVND